MLQAKVSAVSEKEMRTNPRGMSPRIDAKHHIPIKDNFFSTLELTHIKNTLYRTKEEEFIASQIWTQTTEWEAGAREVGYDRLEPVSEARIGSQGAYANDIPFVSEKLDEQTQKAIEIEVGIRYSRQEVEAAEAVNRIGRGANLNIVQERARTARRAVSRVFDKGIFQGYSQYGFNGLQSIIPVARQVTLPTDNNTVAYESVPDTGTGSSTLWSTKTGQLIIKDLNRGKVNGVERGNIFRGQTLIVDTAAYAFLTNPYSDLNGRTILSFVLESKMFDNVFVTNSVALANNGRNNTYFVICDNDVDVAEIAILRPLTVYPSETEFNQEVKQLVAMRTGGLLVKYNAGFYFGDGHIEVPA